MDMLDLTMHVLDMHIGINACSDAMTVRPFGFPVTVVFLKVIPKSMELRFGQIFEKPLKSFLKGQLVH